MYISNLFAALFPFGSRFLVLLTVFEIQYKGIDLIFPMLLKFSQK